MSRAAHILLAGEYPPRPGGVADFTRLLAAGLAEVGEDVYVVAPLAGNAPADPGVSVLRLPDLGLRSLWKLRKRLNRLATGARALVQYAPHSFGWRGMNVPFCRWLGSLEMPVDLFFHEVAFPRIAGQPVRHVVLSHAQRWMARLALRSADRVFVATAAWIPLLRELGLDRDPVPIGVPSNLPENVDAGMSARIRRAAAPNGEILIGHFGTYGAPITALLGPALRSLLVAAPLRRAVLVGRGSDDYASYLVGDWPALAGRILATGSIDALGAAAHLAASDLLLQPYPDGATTRRGSLMAGLALGCAIVTNSGTLSEDFWAESGAVGFVSERGNLVTECERLLADEGARKALSARARTAYTTAFCWDSAVAALRSP